MTGLGAPAQQAGTLAPVRGDPVLRPAVMGLPVDHPPLAGACSPFGFSAHAPGLVGSLPPSGPTASPTELAGPQTM